MDPKLHVQMPVQMQPVQMSAQLPVQLPVQLPLEQSVSLFSRIFNKWNFYAILVCVVGGYVLYYTYRKRKLANQKLEEKPADVVPKKQDETSVPSQPEVPDLNTVFRNEFKQQLLDLQGQLNEYKMKDTVMHNREQQLLNKLNMVQQQLKQHQEQINKLETQPLQINAEVEDNNVAQYNLSSNEINELTNSLAA